MSDSLVPSSRPPLAKTAPSLDELSRELDACTAPSAKAGPALEHAAENAPALERFRAAVDELGRVGWSWDRIARRLRKPRVTVRRIYDGHLYVPAWMLDEIETWPEVRGTQAQATRLRIAQLRKAG